jgi:hypothetical protein
MWTISVSADHLSVDILPDRTQVMHVNTVRMLEVAPCSHCLTISDVQLPSPNVVIANLTLTHPFPGLIKYTGFDVRGIFITKADYAFAVSGRSIAWGSNVPVLLNPDGYTPLFNPTEFPSSGPLPPALKYFPGKYSPGGDLSAKLNPFIAYAKDAPRRMFEAGTSKTEQVRLRLPDGPFQFGYAVDASWTPVDNVIDPENDFPPEANSLEAYELDVELDPGLSPTPGSAQAIRVGVFDWQGHYTISQVAIESPQLFDGESVLTFSGITDQGSFQYTGQVVNMLGAGVGKYPVLVRVTDTESDTNFGVVEAFNVVTTEIGPKDGWAVAWGGPYAADPSSADFVGVDSEGNVYAAGLFEHTIDLDPGPGFDIHSASSFYEDIFIVKLDKDGKYLWGCTWGLPNAPDRIHDMDVDKAGNVYAVGQFLSTIDFDPGSGVDEHTSNGSWDVYVTKFNKNGGHEWARTWGGFDSDGACGVVVDENLNVYISSFFSLTVDFDPGDGTDIHTTNESTDVCLSKLDKYGNFLWARSWGGDSSEFPEWGAGVDGSGNVYIPGEFQNTVDFDPGPDTDLHTSKTPNLLDYFVTKFDSGGNHVWAITWGGYENDWLKSISVDTLGNVFVTGPIYSESIDCDPGPGVVKLYQKDGWNFLSKFDSSGILQWACNWQEQEGGYTYVAADGQGGAYVVGMFINTIDLDPGPGLALHESKGFGDAFLNRFLPDGTLYWGVSWGGPGKEHGNSVACDGDGNAYAAGHFSEKADFDPGPGVFSFTDPGGGDCYVDMIPADGSW